MGIKNLLYKLGCGGELFKFSVYERSVKNDVADVFFMQKKKDVAGLIDLWHEKLKNNNFEMNHPDRKVKTRAVYSVQLGMTNFVFMIDNEGRHPWIIGQCQFLIDIAITEDSVYTGFYDNSYLFFPHFKKLSFVNPDDIFYRDVGFGFRLSQVRPYHYFYDHFRFFLEFGWGVKSVDRSSSFFIPENISSIDECAVKNEKKVFLFPSVIGDNYVSSESSDLVRKLDEKMERIVCKESLSVSHDLPVFDDRRKAVVWFGITGQKRSWLEQIEACVNIVNCLVGYFEKVIVYIDGMTAKQGLEDLNSEDDTVFRKIKKYLSTVEAVELNSLVGLDYRKKILLCSSVDIFIANAGTGCMVPLKFLKKPGVLHSNTKFSTFSEGGGYVKFTDKRFTLDVGEKKSPAALLSYHIPWQHVFNLAAEVLFDVKNIEIHRLEVPSVMDIKKLYDQRVGGPLKVAGDFNSLQDRIKKDTSPASVLREVAFLFEKDGDIHTAMKVMEKAHFLRPDGPVIKRKLDEYKNILKT